jgi:hypothetical protein
VAELVISQIKTRGLNGGSDEWVEIYNPGTVAVTFDNTWALKSRNAMTMVSGCTVSPYVAYGVRFNGDGKVIAPHGHILYANAAGFSESLATPADDTYPSSFGITDAASVVLVHGNAVVDAVCFYWDPTQLTTLTTCPTPYTCNGTPVINPHDNMGDTDANESLERKPGGSGGNTQNTGDNSKDFQVATTADPHDLASTPVP